MRRSDRAKLILTGCSLRAARCLDILSLEDVRSEDRPMISVHRAPRAPDSPMTFKTQKQTLEPPVSFLGNRPSFILAPAAAERPNLSRFGSSGSIPKAAVRSSCVEQEPGRRALRTLPPGSTESPKRIVAARYATSCPQITLSTHCAVLQRAGWSRPSGVAARSSTAPTSTR